MAVVEGKTPAERNKMIAAIVLGAIALISLAYMLFGSSSKPTTTNAKPTPSRATVGGRQTVQTQMPVQPTEENYIPTTLVSKQSVPAVPEAGRNIFAFYIPPTPTPTPLPTPIPTPPPPQPNVNISSISPVNIYAHSGDFTLDVMGDKFTPDTHIFFGGTELLTRFVSPQQLSAKVSAQLISFEGGRNIEVRSRDGKLFSNTATLNVMPAPVPNYTFIGVTLRPRGNNSAILKEKNGKDLLNIQLGDLLGGRFRVTSISEREVTVVDTTLKLKYVLSFVSDSQNSAPGQPRYQPPPQPPASSDDDPEP